MEGDPRPDHHEIAIEGLCDEAQKGTASGNRLGQASVYITGGATVFAMWDDYDFIHAWNWDVFRSTTVAEREAKTALARAAGIEHGACNYHVQYRP